MPLQTGEEKLDMVFEVEYKGIKINQGILDSLFEINY